MNPDEELALAKKAAYAAGEIIMSLYHKPYHSKAKAGDLGMVTDADLAADKAIKKNLDRAGYPILSEETADDLSRLDSISIWIIDPIDGTQDFIEKSGEFAVSIGLVRNNKSVLGVAYEPAKGQLLFAMNGKGAFFEKDGKTTRIHTLPSPKRSLRVLGSRNAKDLDKQLIAAIPHSAFSTTGGFVSKIMKVITGEYDTLFKKGDHCDEWDTCAVDLILQEAGGRMTDLFGNSLSYNQQDVTRPRGIIATRSGVNHDLLVQTFKPLIGL